MKSTRLILFPTFKYQNAKNSALGCMFYTTPARFHYLSIDILNFRLYGYRRKQIIGKAICTEGGKHACL